MSKTKALAKTTLPRAAADGAVIVNGGKYARHAVLAAFEMLGGVPAMVEWAKEHPGEFYTKLFARTIQKDVEVQSSRSVEDLLGEIDGEVVDAEFEDV